MSIRKHRGGVFGKPLSALKSYYINSSTKEIETIGNNLHKNLIKVMQDFDTNSIFINYKFDILDDNQVPLYLLDENKKQVRVEKSQYLLTYGNYQNNVKLFETKLSIPSLRYNDKLKQIAQKTYELTQSEFLSMVDEFIIDYKNTKHPLQIFSYIKEKSYSLYICVHNDHVVYIQFICQKQGDIAYNISFHVYHVKYVRDSREFNFFDSMLAKPKKTMKWTKVFDETMSVIKMNSRKTLYIEDIIQIIMQHNKQFFSPKSSTLHTLEETTESLNKLTVKDLQIKARRMGISYSGRRKAELINDIVSRSSVSSASFVLPPPLEK